MKKEQEIKNEGDPEIKWCVSSKSGKGGRFRIYLLRTMFAFPAYFKNDMDRI